MGSSRPSYSGDTRIPTPAMVPGATDVSSGTEVETTRSRELTKQRKKRGVASTYRAAPETGAATVAGKARLGD